MCTGAHDFIPADNTVKVAMYFDTDGGKAMHVLHFVKPDTWSESDCRNFHGYVSEAWNTNCSPGQANTVVCSRIVVTDLGSEDSFEYDAAPTTDLTGGLASPVMPGNVTVATKFGTGHAGRSYRGRAYWIGLTEGQCVGDQLGAGAGAFINGAWTDFAGALHDSDLEASLAIVSYCNEGAWRLAAQVTPVTAFTTENTLDSMRTRLAGRGM